MKSINKITNIFQAESANAEVKICSIVFMKLMNSPFMIKSINQSINL